MKSNKHEGCERQFVVTSQAWYASAQHFEEGEDEITVGMYHPDGGTTGEFSIRWTMLGATSSPYLHAFSDSWSALQQFQDLLQRLAKMDDTDPSVSAVIAVLLECGVVDATERTGPRSKNAGSITEVERAVQIYRGTLQAYETLRAVAREQGNAPTWAENAEFGAPTKDLSKIDAGLAQQVLDLAKTLIVRRKAVNVVVACMGNPTLEAKYEDILAAPAGVKVGRRWK